MAAGAGAWVIVAIALDSGVSVGIVVPSIGVIVVLLAVVIAGRVARPCVGPRRVLGANDRWRGPQCGQRDRDSGRESERSQPVVAHVAVLVRHGWY